ncbi:DgyrCDS7303 [Dimorphilus gyrociliatus]|uniref:DgyrCDS7303 n=1 Tax=Dimorphilus gyrociliatus TaxID=2664684 RepID=A0A7I8VVL6_9ANNE|nr:DgyrCDS7303 [Dimorphilus gyrociliatus]
MTTLLAVRACLSQAYRTVTPSSRNLLRERIPQIRSQRHWQSQARTPLKRKILTPKVETSRGADAAFGLGKGVVAGASALGIGALCFYGLGLSSEAGTADKAAVWPEYVRERVKSTYMYFGSGIGITAASAYAISRSAPLMRLVSRTGWVSLLVSMAAVLGTGAVARSIPYKGEFGAKQVAWMVHVATMGAIVAPLTLLGGPIMLRAASYTAGIVGGLSTLAMCAPSDKFLNMGGPLAMGLGVVFMSSIGSMFLPPTSVFGAGLYSITVYGGLVLFGLFLLYDTQKIVKRAEDYPAIYGFKGEHGYDPINNSISIYLDTMNIFIRLAMIFAGGGNKRR